MPRTDAHHLCAPRAGLAGRLLIIIAMTASMLTELIADDQTLFRVISVPLAMTLSQNVLVADLHPSPGQELILIGYTDQAPRLMMIYSIGDTTAASPPRLIQSLSLPNDLLFYDLNQQPGQADQLLWLSNQGVLSYNVDSNALSLLHPTRSIFLQPEANFLAPMDFSLDLNGDGREDLVIQDFHEVHLFLAGAEGQWQAQHLPVQARMQLNEGRPVYALNPLYSTRMNADDQLDLVTFGAEGLRYYAQNSAGQFASEPVIQTLPFQISQREWWETRNADGQQPDLSDLSHRKLVRATDLNGDQSLDLIVKHTTSSGVFKQRNDYEVFLGVRDSAGLSFPVTANSALRSDSTQFDIVIHDFNQDQRLDIYIPSLDIGVGQIISALVSGEVDMDYDFYTMGDDGAYPIEANLNKEVKMTFDLSSGRSDSPLMLVSDFNGDGLSDLLVNRGDKQLRLHLGERSERLFSRRSQTQTLSLPSDGSLVQAVELNNDGKTDVLFRYSRTDEPAQQQMLMLLIAR